MITLKLEFSGDTHMPYQQHKGECSLKTLTKEVVENTLGNKLYEPSDPNLSVQHVRTYLATYPAEVLSRTKVHSVGIDYLLRVEEKAFKCLRRLGCYAGNQADEYQRYYTTSGKIVFYDCSLCLPWFEEKDAEKIPRFDSSPDGGVVLSNPGSRPTHPLDYYIGVEFEVCDIQQEYGRTVFAAELNKKVFWEDFHERMINHIRLFPELNEPFPVTDYEGEIIEQFVCGIQEKIEFLKTNYS